MKAIFCTIALMGIGCMLCGQSLNTRNVVIVTLDGLRWQELFQGADSCLLFNNEFTTDHKLRDEFWNSSEEVRRRKLFPFFWNTIGTSGQVYGNRNEGNEVNCANNYLFSYPGYSEILTGFVERRVRSNDPHENPNHTLLEFIGQQPGFENKVAAFGTWDAFPSIFREERAGIPVNAGKEMAAAGASDREDLLNELQEFFPNPHGSRYDAFTFFYGFEYMKRQRPRVVFLGFDETDEHAHGGRYDEYLRSAHRTDAMLSRLWMWIQSQPDYRDQTTLVITTDHGRGIRKWQKHGLTFSGSRHAWFMVMGPDTPAIGEMKINKRYYLKQLAATMAALLGVDYSNKKRVGERIDSVINSEALTQN